MDIEAKEIRCPKQSDHVHKKILLVVNDDALSVYCKDHGWIKIEFFRFGDRITFEDVSTKISEYKGKVNFKLSQIPAIAFGVFKLRRKNGSNNK